MPTKLLWSGSSYTIHGWVEGETCAVQQFLAKLAVDGHPDAASMWRLIKDTAQNGPPRNPEKFHNLHGEIGKGLFEFKARGGARIICFFDLKKIICTHGIPKFKPKRFDREAEKGQRVKSAYIAERDAAGRA